MTTGAVSTSAKPLSSMPSPLTHGINWKLFTVAPVTFGKFNKGQKTFSKWEDMLNLSDETEQELLRYVKGSPKNGVVLKCAQSGALKAIKQIV